MKKRRFRVHAEVTISLSTVVFAKNEAEAKKLAEDRAIETIHTQGDEESEWVTSGEIDGVPCKLKAEEENE